MKKGNIVFIIILFVIVVLGVFCLPDIYKSLNKAEKPNTQKEEREEEKEKKDSITIESKVIKELSYPIMRNDKYKIESYYQLDSITLNDFSNNDILYNAFLDIYTGYLVNHDKVGCTTNSKQFDANYLRSRIKNIISKNIKYTLEDFMVPNINGSTDYIGNWKYDSNKDIFIYYGNCEKNDSSIIYDELKKLYKVESSLDNNIIYLYYYIGFVKNEDNNYTIYKDSYMKEEVYKTNDLNTIDYSKFNTYKYTFEKGLCSYENYCFYKGEWIK